MVWTETHLYGSSRLGTYEPNQRLTPSVDTLKKGRLVDGQRRYELTNHLGNVLVTVNDRKQGREFNLTAFTYNFFEAVVIQATDYFPFGLEMPGRTFQAASTTAYRMGFNGKENDRGGSWSGTQLVQDYGARLYNPAIGRWLSIDPKTAKFVSHSPYHFGYCNPLVTIDRDGEENIVVIGGADVSGKDRNKFMSTGLKAFKDLSERDSKEQTTIVVVTAYMTEAEKNEIKTQAKALASGNYGVIFVEKASELTDYFNNKKPTKIVNPFTGQEQSINTRAEDKITDIQIFGHGYWDTNNQQIGNGPSFEPGHGNTSVGATQEYHDKFSWGISEAKKLNPDAFDNPNWRIETCNAATTCYTNGPGYGTNLIQVLTEITGGSGTGWYGKSDYSKINNSSATMRWLKGKVSPADNYPIGGELYSKPPQPSEKHTYNKGKHTQTNGQPLKKKQ